MQEIKPLENENIYNVAVYVRLSKEERFLRPDSESLENQRDIILDYLKDKDDMRVYDIYTDDGETGTNFDREGFQRMMYDVYNGKVNCIIVKDLSRFGREYIEAGDYLDRIFPLLGIRFIAITDNADNHVSPFDISVPIKNIINTMYARDISKKISAALRIKQSNGEFIGACAAYGYKKDPQNKNKIIIDEAVAPIVRQIFEWKAEGIGSTTICRKLYDMGIIPPARYRYEAGFCNDARYKNQVYWNPHTVGSMFINKVYIGVLAQGKMKSNFYNGGKAECIKRDDWIYTENSHEALISQELWDRVQKTLSEQKGREKSKYEKRPESNEYNIFKGKLICGDCGKMMTACRWETRLPKKKDYVYQCYRHASYPEKCSLKPVYESVLKDILRQSIRSQVSQLCSLESVISKIAMSESVRTKQYEITKIMSDSLSNIAFMKTARIRLTNDFANGLLSDEDYANAKVELNRQLSAETERLSIATEERDKIEKIISAEKWIKELKRYVNIKKITREVVDVFVNKIVIYPDKRIEIEWNYQEQQAEILSYVEGGAKIA